MSTKRKLDNWLDTFMQWTLPQSESKESLLFWTGLFTLSAAVNRRVKISKEYLGGWEVAPTMYVIFVGPQGAIRKSSSISFAERLLDCVPTLTKAPEIFTTPILIQAIVKSPDSMIYAIASEFGALMEKDDKLYTALTNLFDHKKNISEETISRGAQFAEKPGISLIGATTPDWIGLHMPRAVLAGGFGSRVIYIKEEGLRRRSLFHSLRKDYDPEALKETEKLLIHDLNHIHLTCQGDFFVAEEDQKFADDWYQDNCDPPPGTNSNLIGFYNRRPAHALKVAMLHSVATKDELVLTREDIQFGIDSVNATIPKLASVFSQVGKNEFKADTESIQNFIKEKGRASHPEILRAFSSAAGPIKLEELINGLLAAEIIMLKMDREKEEAYYEINPEFGDV